MILNFMLALIPVLFLSIQPAFSNEKTKNEFFVISPGGELIKYSLRDTKFLGYNNLLSDKKLSNAYWPSYDKKNGLLYFEAENKDFGLSPQIFCINIADVKENPTQLIEGRNPSISLDGNLLAYYRHPYNLWIFNIKTYKNNKLISNISAYQPAVWISNQYLLYADINNHFMLLDVVSGNTKNTGHDYVIPGALSPEDDQVLCGSYDGMKIFIYSIKNNKLKTIKSSKIFSMSSNFVWSNNSKKFLYTRQTFSNLIRLNEIRSLFLYSLENREEIKLVDKFSLFGGVSISQ